MNKKHNLRSAAALALSQVFDQGVSLSEALPIQQRTVAEKDRALLQEMCFGVLRTYPLLDWLVRQLMARPLSGRQAVIHYLLCVGLYQLLYLRIPDHAVLSETVQGAVTLKRAQLKNVVNGVLRQFLRQREDLLNRAKTAPCRYLHPDWLTARLQRAWPTQWETIIDANNQRPPMWLRVNRQYHTREAYLTLLQNAGITAQAHPRSPCALRLDKPWPVQQLPGFEQGWVTVQDVAAQQTIEWLEPQNGELILDLCAAPGGKTTHILETAPEAIVWAADVSAERMQRVRANLARLHQQANLIVADARQPAEWCAGQRFDRILLDAPCSATGVIRRHPDIKWLRRDSDIVSLVELQYAILTTIWPFLKPGGTLVYATCSVLPEENVEQIRRFMAEYADAQLSGTGDPASPGLQLFPEPEGGDGFFYARLIKRNSPTLD